MSSTWSQYGVFGGSFAKTTAQHWLPSKPQGCSSQGGGCTPLNAAPSGLSVPPRCSLAPIPQGAVTVGCPFPQARPNKSRLPMVWLWAENFGWCSRLLHWGLTQLLLQQQQTGKPLPSLSVTGVGPRTVLQNWVSTTYPDGQLSAEEVAGFGGQLSLAQAPTALSNQNGQHLCARCITPSLQCSWHQSTQWR